MARLIQIANLTRVLLSLAQKQMVPQGTMKMRKSSILVASLSMFLFSIGATAEPQQRIADQTSYSPPALVSARHHPNGSRNGIVVAEEKLAAEIGAEILAEGGNAIDATVATAFALAVTFPRAGNIAGGGFMLIHLKDENKTIALDYREVAPLAASRDMYLDSAGNVIADESTFTHKASGVPGTVAGLILAQEKYGRLSRQQVLAPSIRLAARGFPMTYFNAAMLEAAREDLEGNDAAMEEFFKPDGTGYAPGDTIHRRDLARTLRLISKKGSDGFYKGKIAEQIADEMTRHGGLVTLDDLAAYEVKYRAPVEGTYRGRKIVSMPPPSSGGIHLIQMLNMLEVLLPDETPIDAAESRHIIAETMRSAFADRSEHLGDIDFVSVPIEGLTTKTYAKELAAGISAQSARASSTVSPGTPAYPDESPETTQITVIDKDGNMVSNTYTLNLSYGSGIVVPGTGILLNNEMDDFAVAPGVANSYGLIGNAKNAIAPGKRPLSSMTPAFVFNEDGTAIAVGAPGGARIITSVLQTILNVIDGNMSIADAVAAPRIHHQWQPDTLGYEAGIGTDTLSLLEAKGHTVEQLNWYARPQIAEWRKGWTFGFSDTRVPGGGACTPDTPC